jgi:transcriptional regulator with XRE-family HTH domain
VVKYLFIIRNTQAIQEMIMPGEGKLGERIRAYRERLGMTVDVLGQQSGVDAGVINAIESGDVYPVLGVLIKLSRALGQRLGTFMDDQYHPDPIIMRAGERAADRISHRSGGAGGFEYFPLSNGKTDRHMEPFYIEIAADSRPQLSAHEGEELIIVITGEVELIYGDGRNLLRPGDSAHYNSVVPHIVKSVDGSPASIYGIVFTPF